ncbi:MAG: hypothetical protein ACREDS_05355, partial [Limisphaerales bacterium]
MDLYDANKIVDGIQAVLEEYGGTKFTPLSRVGASTRLEVAQALYLVTAQVFRQVSVRGKTSLDTNEMYNSFVRAAGGSMVTVIMTFLPDFELEAISKMPNPIERLRKRDALDETVSERESRAEWFEEDKRLRSLAMNDDLMKLETIDSFVTYLKTLSLVENEFWPQVYKHIGLD